MKNKIFTFFIVFLVFCSVATYAEEFIIESSEIKILNKGEITEAKNHALPNDRTVMPEFPMQSGKFKS